MARVELWDLRWILLTMTRLYWSTSIPEEALRRLRNSGNANH